MTLPDASKVSAAFRAANPHLYDQNPHAPNPRQTTEPQRPDRERQLALSPQPQIPSAERIHLRIVSVRKRLCDPDNLVPKWYIDALRYCGAIRGDEPDKLTLETSQRKAAEGEEEHTLIEMFTYEMPPTGTAGGEG